ncbi:MULTISPECIES: YchJ family protein [unclassified Sphingobacterium]|uniref:YchJ family protein n=1 Tax=unclassified Sphingobacterium TaxID=2609468 RepID=UPI0020C2AF0A|nr:MULTISPECIES: YchJ family metal-binding protein [unclassified Sphingobacterium]
MNMNCYCGSGNNYEDCCKIVHLDLKNAESAEQLMRARYSAFCLSLVDFLYNSFHPNSRRFQKKSEIEQWSKENKWEGLEIIKATENTVEFRAIYVDPFGEKRLHREKSRFQKLQGTWYYLDGRIIA